jgi:hypothetical protein
MGELGFNPRTSGTATSSGTISATLTWIPDDSSDQPPATVTLEETAEASWAARDVWDLSVPEPGGWSASGSASNGLGHPQVVNDIYSPSGGTIIGKTGQSSGSRFVDDVDSSSGTIVRTLDLSASGTLTVDDYSGFVEAAVSFNVRIHAHPFLYRMTPALFTPLGMNPEIDNDNGSLYFYYEWSSTSGNLNDLAGIRVREYVTYQGNDIGTFQLEFPYFWYYPGAPYAGRHREPTDPSGPAEAGAGEDYHSHGGFLSPFQYATYTGTQTYEFHCPVHHAEGEWERIPGDASGPHPIVRTFDLSQIWGPGYWQYTISKQGYTAIQDRITPP